MSMPQKSLLAVAAMAACPDFGATAYNLRLCRAITHSLPFLSGLFLSTLDRRFDII